jgi:Bacterial protein of unknown function (DUF885)
MAAVPTVTEPVEGSLQRLAARFWSWRTSQQPRSRDDIPRLDRPEGWLPNWSPSAVAAYREQLAGFNGEFGSLDAHDAPVPVQVDHALVASALARVRWELDVVAAWQRQPGFYVDQTIGVLFDRLVVPPPFGDRRGAEIVRTLAAVRSGLELARANLAGHAVEEFARVTVAELADVEEQVQTCAVALVPELPADLGDPLRTAAEDAARALGSFREWLRSGRVAMQSWEPVGQEEFGRFLREVALLAYSPQQLLTLARAEQDRAVALSRIEATSRRAEPPVPVFRDADSQVRREAEDELAVRRFYVEHRLLSQPDSLGHYLTAPLPSYLRPISWLGVTDDLTSEERVGENGVSYVPEPRPDLPYFYAANASDPRCGIVHEGVHYQQLALSWRHPDPIRRHYYDSGANEGIAFYNEELMLQAGLFEDKPSTRSVMYSFMRLRALRVEVDVSLALGAISIEEAAEYLERRVPMDRGTAREEAAFFAALPGQGLTYQVGKSQILNFLADAARSEGEAFDLQQFHDYLWLNGNVPIALLRFERLGLRDEWDLIRGTTGMSSST